MFARCYSQQVFNGKYYANKCFDVVKGYVYLVGIVGVVGRVRVAGIVGIQIFRHIREVGNGKNCMQRGVVLVQFSEILRDLYASSVRIQAKMLRVSA